MTSDYRSVQSVTPHDEADGVYRMTFARFDSWNPIQDHRGVYLEKLDRRAFDRTFSERGSLIRVLFDHGMDPSMGNKVVAENLGVGSDGGGPNVMMRFLDREYAQDIRAGLDAGQYAASYRFGPHGSSGETWDRKPGQSAHNPKGIAERSLHDVDVLEVSIVPFPADWGTQGLVSAVRHLEERYAPDRIASVDLGAGAPEAEVRNDPTTVREVNHLRRRRLRTVGSRIHPSTFHREGPSQ